MRSLRWVALAALFLALPAGAALPQLALACGSAAAGQPVPCTITRLSGGNGVYVLFQTSDGTAHSAADYSAVSQQVYLKGSDKNATVNVPTVVNQNATGTLTFNAAITAGGPVVRAVGSIIEAVAPPPPPAPGVLTAGGNATVIGDEQAVPKVAAEMGFTYGEALYRTVKAGETVKLDPRGPTYDLNGQLVWAAWDQSGKFIGYLFASDLAPAP